ncbi:MAG: hypothetical protein KDE28_02490 [Anaerolineales bacterium]|nr:hypothetical protein [Anaerolineales bacterium]
MHRFTFLALFAIILLSLFVWSPSEEALGKGPPNANELSAVTLAPNHIPEAAINHSNVPESCVESFSAGIAVRGQLTHWGIGADPVTVQDYYVHETVGQNNSGTVSTGDIVSGDAHLTIGMTQDVLFQEIFRSVAEPRTNKGKVRWTGIWSYTRVAGSSGISGGIDMSSDWSYTFGAERDGIITVTYTIEQDSGSLPFQNGSITINGAQFALNEGTGTWTYPVVAGEQYVLSLSAPSISVSGNFDGSESDSGQFDALFEWELPELAPYHIVTLGFLNPDGSSRIETGSVINGTYPWIDPNGLPNNALQVSFSPRTGCGEIPLDELAQEFGGVRFRWFQTILIFYGPHLELHEVVGNMVGSEITPPPAIIDPNMLGNQDRWCFIPHNLGGTDCLRFTSLPTDSKPFYWDDSELEAYGINGVGNTFNFIDRPAMPAKYLTSPNNVILFMLQLVVETDNGQLKFLPNRTAVRWRSNTQTSEVDAIWIKVPPDAEGYPPDESLEGGIFDVEFIEFDTHSYLPISMR